MIYVHVPFCKSFCTYCDFYSEIRSEKVQNLFMRELTEEIEARRDEITSTLALNTLYIGGGTPSVLPLSAIAGIADALGCPPPDEFTVEVNPEDIACKGPAYARGLREAGVNRISMGIQSFDDTLLRWMGRRHDSRRAVEAFGILREAGFDNIGIDLISGISHLDDSVWKDTLRQAAALSPEHISAYQLSIEEGSALAAMVRDGRYEEADAEQCRRQYDILCDTLAAAGYRHYEISNFAKPGREALHNSAYWRRQPYVGLGPGAHSLTFSTPAHGNGREADRRSWNSCTLPRWTSGSEILSPAEIREERIMLGLRTDRGIEPSEVEGKDISSLEKCVGGRLRIPESEWFVSDAIIRDLI